MDILHAVFMGAWGVLVDSAKYILFGFFIAGLLKGFLPTELIAKHLGGEAITKAGKNKRSIVAPVFKAALFGVPLPLCSCGVIPAAAALRDQGASKGATTAFLIATPETGVDSMTVTYGLLDPIMTVVRPLSAFITSVAAGIAVDIFDKNDVKEKTSSIPSTESSCCCSENKKTSEGAFASQMFAGSTIKPIEMKQSAPKTSYCCSAEEPKKDEPVHSCCCSESKPENVATSSCCCSEEKPEPVKSSCCCSDTPTASQASSSCCSTEKVPPKPTVFEKFTIGMQFAFCKLISTIGIWLLFGITLASLISVFIPENMFTDQVTGFAGMLVMMAIGIPMYVCATASTPIAAAFALKGISPGAALVFLLAGPATNVATITIVAKMLGKRAAVIYVTTIGVMTLIIGTLVNYLYTTLGLSVTSWATGSMHKHTGPIDEAAAFILVMLILVQWTKKWRTKQKESSCCCSSK